MQIKYLGNVERLSPEDEQAFFAGVQSNHEEYPIKFNSVSIAENGKFLPDISWLVDVSTPIIACSTYSPYRKAELKITTDYPSPDMDCYELGHSLGFAAIRQLKHEQKLDSVEEEE